MTAGLLTQPRYRKSSFLASGDVSKLKKQVHDLELKVTTQQKLIEILKSLPAAQVRQNATETDPDEVKKVRRSSKTKRGPKSIDCKAQKPSGDGAGLKGINENTEVVEATSEVEGSVTKVRPSKESGQVS
jgi:hypothetical protein